MKTTFVVFNTGRYGECTKFPELITCHDTTLEKARELAEELSSYFAGQEGMFLVAGDEY